MSELENVRNFLFVDEVKNSITNKDGDNSFYYFAVAVPKSKIDEISKAFNALTYHLPNGFHAKKHYKPSCLDLELLNGLTDMFVNFHLPTICFRYDKDLLDRLSKQYLKNIP